MVYNNALQVSKNVYDGEEIYIATNVDTVSPTFTKINGKEFSSYNYSLFVSDSHKDTQMKEKFDAVVPILFQNDKLDTSSWITMMETDSVSVMKKTLLDQEFKKQQQAQEAQQQQIKLEQQKIEAIKQQDLLNKEHEITKIAIENDKDILISEMDAQSKLELEQLKLGFNTSIDESQRKQDIESKKLELAKDVENNRRTENQADLQLKKDKLNIDRIKANKTNK
jgi:hypothetical protein